MGLSKEQFNSIREKVDTITETAMEWHGVAEERKRLLQICKQLIVEITLEGNISSEIQEQAREVLTELKNY